MDQKLEAAGTLQPGGALGTALAGAFHLPEGPVDPLGEGPVNLSPGKGLIGQLLEDGPPWTFCCKYSEFVGCCCPEKGFPL